MNITQIPDSLFSKFRNSSWQNIVTIIVLGFSTLIFAGIPTTFFRSLIKSNDDLLPFLLPVFVGLVFLVSGFWVYFVRRNDEVGISLGAFLAIMSMVVITIPAYMMAEENTWVGIFRIIGAAGSAIAAVEIIQTAFVFPKNDTFVEKNKSLQLIPLGIIIIQFCVLGFILNPTRPAFATSQYIILSLGILFFIFWVIFQKLPMVMFIERDQALVVLAGSIIAFPPAIILLIGTFFNYIYLYSPYFLLMVLTFPLLVDVSLLRSRLVSSGYVFHRSMVYISLFIILSLGYALMVSGFGLIFSTLSPVNNPLIIGLIIFVLALLFDPLRQFLRNAVDRLFFRGEKAYQENLKNFNSDLTKVVGLLEIIKVVRKYIAQSLSPIRLHVYIYDPLSEQFVATLDELGELTSDLRFAGHSPLVQYLSNTKAPLIIGREGVPDILIPEKTRLNLLSSVVYIPLSSQGKLSGWAALGRRSSGEIYHTREINFIQSICEQAALSIERAQVVANLEDRVREMNVLSRVSQGINITLMLDDILELIYAQSTQIISADDFHIMLLDERTKDLIEIFYIQENDRMQQFENLTVTTRILEQEVIRLRRPIVTPDYARECQTRGIPVTKVGIYAWMGVPLNAGAGTIGALSLAKRDLNVTYTQQQLSLLQSIADQAAGAIVKARLLEETQRRAKHLQSLNEVSRQLTSTLELDPLLKGILHSASDILNCEAGSLLMVDENTDDLVFKVTVGPVAQSLLNTRTSKNSGLAGKAMNSKQPVMVNDVQASEEWSSSYDKQTGFITRSVLVVPLQVMDRMIGVIEVINKRDFTAFNVDDLELLTAFAAQAGIAIENARLYQMTDRELAERVEELSVLQRIGRELNTSLDTQKAMKITLDWAKRQSKATVGILGLVKDGELSVVSHEGLGDDQLNASEVVLPSNSIGVHEAIDSGIPQRMLLNPAHPGLIPASASRVVIPIRRETNTIGILILEFNTTDLLSDNALNFLLRLSDQASIAIANAQLYDAVQAANLAKSEFVSFVSHELKNPMTSIKGYSELIAAGAVGPITEAQGNFLGTIRSNVERMSTLVSDLADISRIEADRLRLDFKAQNSKEMLDEVMRSMRKQFEEKNIEVEIGFPDKTPQIWADRTRVIQIITNLLSNACKYTPNNGKVYVNAEATSNLWDPEGAPEVVHIAVRDTGIGINEEDQRKIFQKFFRSEDPKTREAPGTGLGLSITKSLVEKQGGKIWFESEFRKGTTFHITIPVSA
jgi:signal transduction histidine kinase